MLFKAGCAASGVSSEDRKSDVELLLCVATVLELLCLISHLRILAVSTQARRFSLWPWTVDYIVQWTMKIVLDSFRDAFSDEQCKERAIGLLKSRQTKADEKTPRAGVFARNNAKTAPSLWRL